MPTKRVDVPRTILEFTAQKGIVRLRELVAAGFAKSRVRSLCEKGELTRLSRGLYALPNREVSNQEALVQVAKRVPKGVFCLLTALRIHDLTDQNASSVWLAVERKSRRPKLDWPPLEIVWWSTPILEFGVEFNITDGVELRVTTPAKTVADTIKYRNKVGKEVAIQAVRDYRRKRMPINELVEASRFCRVENILRGFLEVML